MPQNGCCQVGDEMGVDVDAEVSESGGETEVGEIRVRWKTDLRGVWTVNPVRCIRSVQKTAIGI